MTTPSPGGRLPLTGYSPNEAANSKGAPKWIKVSVNLLNQYDILKLFDPQQTAQYDLSQAIISGGYTTRSGETHNAIHEDELPGAVQQEVYDVLDVFRALDFAKRRGWAPSDLPNTLYEGLSSDVWSFAGSGGNRDSHSPRVLATLLPGSFGPPNVLHPREYENRGVCRTRSTMVMSGSASRAS